jgi:hypothetical protein
VTACGPVAIADADDGEALRVFDGEGAQPHGVEELEDRGVGTYAERQGENGDDGETWVETQQTEGMPDVLPQSLHRRTSTRGVLRSRRR